MIEVTQGLLYGIGRGESLRSYGDGGGSHVSGIVKMKRAPFV